MANKKKKKPATNPARGFATVSVASKISEIDADHNQESEQLEQSLKKPSVQQQKRAPTSANQNHDRDQDLSQMSPEELEQHFKKAEILSMLNANGKRSRNDASRQKARLETELRSLRREAMSLETDSWLAHVLQEILDLTRSSWPSALTTQAPQKLSDTDLCMSIWSLKLTFELMRLPHGDKVLRDIIDMSPIIPAPDSKSLLWGFDEAVTRLALIAETNDLPSYDRHQTVVSDSPDSRSRSPSPIRARKNLGDTSETVSSDITISLEHDSPPLGQENDSKNAHSISSSSEAKDGEKEESEADSGDEDPERLTEKFLNAKYEILKHSLIGDGSFDHKKLSRTIEKIQADVLFDHKEAGWRWADIQRDLETEHARNSSAARRQHMKKQPEMMKGQVTIDSLPRKTAMTHETSEGEDILGSLFDTDENQREDEEPKLSASVLLRDFGALGTGLSPRRVLGDVCKARDPSCKINLVRISQSSFSYRHEVQIIWSRGQALSLGPSFVPPDISFDFQFRSSIASMISTAAPSALQSEGYICTVMLFMLSQSTGDDKIPFSLASVWRDLWKELAEARRVQMENADVDALEHIQSLMSEDRSIPGPDMAQPEKDIGLPAYSHRPKDFGARASVTAAPLSAIWREKASTTKFQRMLRTRKQLPIWHHRQEITETVKTNQVTVICAETGAGKSTQIPSFLLEDQLCNGNDFKVYVTQPRRISALSLARRVSEELGEARTEIGTYKSLVGFAVRLESKTSDSTRITYMTTGVLLRMLASSKGLAGCDCIVLDEVHERTMDLDLIFITIRRLLKSRPSLQVVLMSATVDATKFSNYFDGAPVLNIPGRSFPVEIMYLEDAIEHASKRNAGVADSAADVFEPELSESDEPENRRTSVEEVGNYSAETLSCLAKYDEYKIDYNLIAKLVFFISVNRDWKVYGKAFLIFMPGIGEIRRLNRLFTSSPAFQHGWVIHLLHSSFSNEDLEKAFEPAPTGHGKIVIATNIAETGITIPDITAVIDTCKEKVMRFDEKRQASRLNESFISRSSARQRRGRAARVQKGLCFHLITRYRHDKILLEHHVPEMLRLSLQDAILQIKILGLGDIEQTLNEAFDPPTIKNVRRAIQLMKDVKALTSTEALTSLGRQLAKLPLDMWLAKLVLYGVQFACLDATVFVAAMLSTKSPFVDGDDSDGRATAARLAFNKGNSDLMLAYEAYSAWRRAHNSGNAYFFCKKNFLSQSILSQIEDQKCQLLITLSDNGVISLNETEKGLLRDSRYRGWERKLYTVPHRYSLNDYNASAVSSAIAMAFYPKLLVRESDGWRQITNNQRPNVARSSVNHFRKLVSAKQVNDSSLSDAPPRWLSFYQTIQTKAKNPTALETSAVPDFVVAILLGSDADFKMYAGVISLENGKVRFAVRDWMTMVAIRALRKGIQDALARSFRAKNQSLPSELDRKWLAIWQKILDGPERAAIK